MAMPTKQEWTKRAEQKVKRTQLFINGKFVASLAAITLVLLSVVLLISGFGLLRPLLGRGDGGHASVRDQLFDLFL